MIDNQQNEDEYLILRPIPLSGHCLALCVFIFLLFLLRWKLFFGDHPYYLGGSHGDAGLYLWLFRHHLHYLFELSYFDTNAFFPYPLSLAWSDNFILPALIVYPLHLVGIGTTTLYNTVLLGAQMLSAYCTFRTTYLLRGELQSAIITGCLPLLIAYFTTALGHPQLAFSFVFPLGFELLFRAIRAPVWWGAVYGVLVTCTFLTTVYYAIFLSLLPVIFFASHLLVRPTYENSMQIPKFVFGGILSVPVLVLIALPYIEVKKIFGARSADEMAAFGAEGASLLSSSPLSQLYSFTSSISHAEAYFFPGLILLGLAILSFQRIYNGKPLLLSGRFLSVSLSLLLLSTSFKLLMFMGLSGELLSVSRQYIGPLLALTTLVAAGLLLRKLGSVENQLGCGFLTNRSHIAILITIGIVFFIIALGPLGRASKNEWQLGPFMILYWLFPGFDSVRAISRAAIPTLYVMILLAGFSVSRLSAKLPEKKKIISFGLLLLIGIENLLIAYPIEPRDGAPAALRELQLHRNSNDATLFLPMTDEVKPNRTVKSWKNFATRNVNYMNWSVDYDLLTVNGYSGQRTKIMKELPGITSTFPDDESIKALAKISNLKYIVFGSPFISNFNREAFEEKLRYYGRDLEYLTRDVDGFYLLRYKGEVKLNDAFSIRAPLRWPEDQFTFELKTEYEPDALLARVDLHELDHHQGAIVHSVTLPKDGEWHTFSAPLPLHTTTSLPFRFIFRTEKSVKLFYRNGAISFENP